MLGYPSWPNNKAGYQTLFISSPTTTPAIGITNGNTVYLPQTGEGTGSNWYLYPAKSNVTAELAPINPIVPQPRRIHDLSNFRTIKATNLTLERDLLFGGNLTAVRATVPTIIGTDADFSTSELGQADVNIYGALYVEGGTTLTGGGTVHGITIGALRAGPVDTVRIDVLPIGIDMTSPTYITMNALAAANLTTGGALSLAGGSYIEYNTDQNYFINTTNGNDQTTIFVGNLNGAFEGSEPLRIVEPRGVVIQNVSSIEGNVSSFARLTALSSIFISSSVASFSTIIGPFGSNLSTNLSGISNVSTYSGIAQWAKFPAVSNVDLSYNTINNITSFSLYNSIDDNNTTYLQTIENARHLCYTDGVNTPVAVAGDWSWYPAASNPDINYQDIVNVNNIFLNTIQTPVEIEYITMNSPVLVNSNINMNFTIISNVGGLYFNPYAGMVAENIDGVDYLVTQAPYKVWNKMIILDTGGNNPVFKMSKQTSQYDSETELEVFSYIDASINFDGYFINFDYGIFLQGKSLGGASVVEFVNRTTGNSASLTFKTQMYNNGDEYEELAYNDVPFLYKTVDSLIELISVADIQFIDSDNSNFNYLGCRNNELFIENFNTDHNLVKEIPVASYWSSYKAHNTVDLSSNDLIGVTKIKINGFQQPMIQFGRVNIGPTLFTTVILDQAYINNKYSIHITRIGSSTYSATQYVDDVTTNSFRVNGDVPDMEFSWTTYGFDSP